MEMSKKDAEKIRLIQTRIGTVWTGIMKGSRFYRKNDLQMHVSEASIFLSFSFPLYVQKSQLHLELRNQRVILFLRNILLDVKFSAFNISPADTHILSVVDVRVM